MEETINPRIRIHLSLRWPSSKNNHVRIIRDRVRPKSTRHNLMLTRSVFQSSKYKLITMWVKRSWWSCLCSSSICNYSNEEIGRHCDVGSLNPCINYPVTNPNFVKHGLINVTLLWLELDPDLHALTWKKRRISPLQSGSLSPYLVEGGGLWPSLKTASPELLHVLFSVAISYY